MENLPAAAQKIFFSYSRSDGQEHALKLANDLRSAGANVWIDQLDIELGKLWDLEVEKALNTADCVLFIATEKSTASNNVLNEVYYALDENKKVIPVVFHDCRIPFQLRRLQRIDFTTDYNTAFQRLLKALGFATAPTLSKAADLNKPVMEAKEISISEPAEKTPTPISKEKPVRPEQTLVSQMDTGVKPTDQPEKTSFEKQAVKEKSVDDKGNKSRKGIYLGIGAVAVAALIFLSVKVFSGNEQPNKNDATVFAKQYPGNTPKDSGSLNQPVTEPTGDSTMHQTSKNVTTGEKGKPAKKDPAVKPIEPSAAQRFNDFFHAGVSHYNNKSYKDAIADFINATTLKEDAEANHYLGLCYSGLEDYTNAIPYYSKAIEQSPNKWEYYASRAAANHNNKDFKASVSDWDRVIALTPDNGMAYYRRGVNKRAINDLSGACNDFSAAAKLGNADGQNNYDKFCGSAAQPPIKANRGINQLVQKPVNRVKSGVVTKKADY